MATRSFTLFAACLASAVMAAPTFAGLGVWTPLGPSGGRFFSVTVDPRHPEVVYASAAGGFYKSTDGGRRWASLSPRVSEDCSTRSLLIDEANPGSLFLGSQGGVSFSPDGGQTWEPRNTGLSGQPTNFVAQDPNDPKGLFTGTATRLYRSGDRGITWSPIANSPSRVARLIFHPNNPQLVLAQRSGALLEGTGFFKSRDGGATWSPSGAGIPTAVLLDSALDPERPNTVYAVGTGFYTSADFGDTWTVFAGSDPSGINGIGADPRRPGRLWTAGLSGVLRSDNRGASWTRLAVPLTDTLVDVTVAPNDSNHLWVLSTDGIAESRTGGTTWEPMAPGLSGYQPRELSADSRAPGRLWAAIFNDGEGSGLFRSEDGGQSWEPSQTLPRPSLLSLELDPETPDGLFVTVLGFTPENSGIFHTGDRGSSWLAKNAGLTPGGVVEQVVFDPDSPSIAYSATNTGVYKSTNGGESWSLANTGLPENPVLELAIHPVSGVIFAAVFRDGVYKTTDGGTSWQSAQEGLFFDVLALAAHPTNAGWVYAGTSDGRVFRSTDGGAHWTASAEAPTTAPIIAVLIHPQDPNRLYVASFGGGAHKSLDGGQSWEPLGEGPGTGFLMSMALSPGDPSTLYAGVFQGGAFAYSEASSAGLTAAIGLPVDPIVAGVPTTFRDFTAGGPSQRTWLFGDGFTSDEANPQHTFELPGTYTVKLRVAGPGVGGEDSETIVVAPRGTSSCSPSATRLCLNQGRFALEVEWQTPQGASGLGQAVNLTADTGYFWFFNPNNVELIAKVLNGCPVNSRYWVFAGGLTNVRTILTVTDTTTGATRTYTNPVSTPFQPIQDTGAFATCP